MRWDGRRFKCVGHSLHSPSEVGHKTWSVFMVSMRISSLSRKTKKAPTGH